MGDLTDEILKLSFIDGSVINELVACVCVAMFRRRKDRFSVY